MQLIINPAAMIEFSSKLSLFCSTGSFLQAASYDIHGQSKHEQSKHTAHTKHKASSPSDAHGGSWETQPHIRFLFLRTRPLITSKSGDSDHHQRKALGPLLHPVYIQYAQINSCYSIQLNDGTHTFSLVLKTMNFEVSRNARICGEPRKGCAGNKASAGVIITHTFMSAQQNHPPRVDAQKHVCTMLLLSP